MEFRGHRGRFWISVILIVLVADLALGGLQANGKSALRAAFRGVR